MSEFRPPPVRSMPDWDRFCDETGQPRPAVQLAEARAAGDTWLADRIEKTILRCGGEIPRVQYGVQRIDPLDEDAVKRHETAAGQIEQFAADLRAIVERVGEQCRDWLDQPAYSRRLWRWLDEHHEVAWIVVGLVVALGVGILIGRA